MTRRKKKQHSQERSSEPPVGVRISQWQSCALCGSSDAMAIYEKEDPERHYQSWCFSCRGIQTAWTEPELYDIVDIDDAPKFYSRNKHNHKPKEQNDMTEEKHAAPTSTQDVSFDFEYKDIVDWGISKEVCEDISMAVHTERFPTYVERKIFANYKNEQGQITAQKVRVQTLKFLLESSGDVMRDASGKPMWETTSDGSPKWEIKKNSQGKEIKCMWYGNVADVELYGMDRARRQSSKKIMIVEGEKDLAAFVEMFPNIAVVSVKDGAGGAAKDCKKYFQFLNSYDEIYVCGDNDEAGKQMNKAVAELFPRKHKVVHLDKFKDVHDYFINGAKEEFKFCFFNAKRQVPQMVKPISELMPILFEPRPPAYCSYPWPSFNEKLGGVHGGEVVGITGLESRGKSTILRNLGHHIWKETGDPVGLILLEDTPEELIEGIVSVHLKKNLRDPKIRLATDTAELRQAANELLVDDRIYFKAEGGPGEVDDLMDVIDWMVAVGCKVIFFDNVSTLIVGDTMSDSERQGIDNLITECRDRATANNITIFVVQHLNPNGQPRGSRMLNITASTIIELQQEDTSDDDSAPPEAKLVTDIICRKNRRLGKKGKMAYLYYDPETSILTEANQQAIIAVQTWKEKVKEESKKRN